MYYFNQLGISVETLRLWLAATMYIRSNLWSMREKTSATAVELEIMQTARMTLARSPPGTTSQ